MDLTKMVALVDRAAFLREYEAALRKHGYEGVFNSDEEFARFSGLVSYFDHVVLELAQSGVAPSTTMAAMASYLESQRLGRLKMEPDKTLIQDIIDSAVRNTQLRSVAFLPADARGPEVA